MCKRLRGICSLEGVRGVDMDALYHAACESDANMPKMVTLSDLDVSLAYGSLDGKWRAAFLDRASRAKCDAVDVDVDIEPLHCFIRDIWRRKHGQYRVTGVNPDTKEAIYEEVRDSGSDFDEEEGHWHTAMVESDEFTIGGKAWRLRLQLLRTRGSLGIFVVSRDLERLGAQFTMEEMNLMEAEDFNEGSVRVAIHMENRIDKLRSRRRHFCNAFSLLSTSWGWNNFMPAGLLVSDDIGYVHDGVVKLRVKFQFWLNDILAQDFVGPPGASGDPEEIASTEGDLRSRDVYRLWQSLLCDASKATKRGSRWECTSMNASAGELVLLTDSQREWLDRVVAQCATEEVQGDRIKGRVLRTWLLQGRDEAKTEAFLRERRHIGVSCDGCGASQFTGVRTRCLVCHNFDLCDACAKHGVVSYRHSTRHHGNLVDPWVFLPAV